MTQGLECSTDPFAVSLIGTRTASLPRLRKVWWPWPLWSGPFQLFAFGGHRAAASLENRSARVAEIGLVLPQAVLDLRGVGDVAAAESEGVGRARSPLLGGAMIFLRKGIRCAKESCGCDRTTVGFRNHIGSLL